MVARTTATTAPTTASYGAGALQAYEEMVDLTREARLPPPPRPRHHELRREQGQGARAARPPRRRAGRRRRHHPRHLPLHPRLHDARRDAAELGERGRPGRDPGPAARTTRRAETHPARTWRWSGADGCHGVPIEWDTIEISGVERPGARAPASAGPSPQSAAAARRGALDHRPPAAASTTGWARRSSSTSGHEENVRAIMRHRVHTGGSDGILQGFKPHPRAYGTFPQYLGRYVRELGVLSLEECVAHLTSRPAARLRLPDRGLVREGYRADLVLFDPETVAAGSTFEAPRTLPDRHPARPDRRQVRDARTAGARTSSRDGRCGVREPGCGAAAPGSLALSRGCPCLCSAECGRACALAGAEQGVPLPVQCRVRVRAGWPRSSPRPYGAPLAGAVQSPRVCWPRVCWPRVCWPRVCGGAAYGRGLAPLRRAPVQVAGGCSAAWAARPSAIRCMTSRSVRSISGPIPQRVAKVPCQWMSVPPASVGVRSMTAR